MFEAAKPRGQYRYLGVFGYAGWETIVTPDADGYSLNAIRFILAPITDIPRDETQAQNRRKYGRWRSSVS